MVFFCLYVDRVSVAYTMVSPAQPFLSSVVETRPSWCQVSMLQPFLSQTLRDSHWFYKPQLQDSIQGSEHHNDIMDVLAKPSKMTLCSVWCFMSAMPWISLEMHCVMLCETLWAPGIDWLLATPLTEICKDRETKISKFDGIIQSLCRQ